MLWKILIWSFPPNSFISLSFLFYFSNYFFWFLGHLIRSELTPGSAWGPWGASDRALLSDVQGILPFPFKFTLNTFCFRHIDIFCLFVFGPDQYFQGLLLAVHSGIILGKLMGSQSSGDWTPVGYMQGKHPSHLGLLL